MTPETIERFTGPHLFLSNFYPVTIIWAGIEFPSAEHAFQAGKTLDEAERMRIAAAPSPAAAKRIGRWVQRRSAWDAQVRYEVMTRVLELKFAVPDLRRRLLATGDADLIEGSLRT